jgi:hypothetical protein
LLSGGLVLQITTTLRNVTGGRQQFVGVGDGKSRYDDSKDRWWPIVDGPFASIKLIISKALILDPLSSPIITDA